jgi:xanthine phosphoribosyltransferase
LAWIVITKNIMSENIYHNEKYVSWDEIQGICRFLAARIHREAPNLTKILTITRGGLIPAGIIARELGIRHIDTIGIGSYDGMVRGELKILKDCSEEYSRDVLVIDDLADTGATLKLLRERLVNPRVATLFVKPAGRDSVDWFVEEVAQDTWVRFPWDTVRQYVEPLVP